MGSCDSVTVGKELGLKVVGTIVVGSPEVGEEVTAIIEIVSSRGLPDNPFKKGTALILIEFDCADSACAALKPPHWSSLAKE